MEDPVFDASVNVMGSLNVLECSRWTGVRKVVYAASGGNPLRGAAEAAGQGDGSHRLEPVSPYGISKKVVIDYLVVLRAPSRDRRGRRSRSPTCTARARTPHGEAGVVAIFSSKMLAGEAPTIFGDGNQTRDYVFVDDVGARLRARCRTGQRAARQCRNGHRDVGERLVPDAVGDHRVRGRARPRAGAPGRSSPERRWISRSRRTSSGGGPGRTSRTASPRRSRSSGDRPAEPGLGGGGFSPLGGPPRRGHHEPWPPSSRSVRQTPSNACSGSW